MSIPINESQTKTALRREVTSRTASIRAICKQERDKLLADDKINYEDLQMLDVRLSGHINYIDGERTKYGADLVAVMDADFELLKGAAYTAGPDYNSLVTEVNLVIDQIEVVRSGADQNLSYTDTATNTPIYYTWTGTNAPAYGKVDNANLTTLYTRLDDVVKRIDEPDALPS